MRRTAVKKAWVWPEDSTPKSEQKSDTVLVDTEALAGAVVETMERLRPERPERVRDPPRRELRREDEFLFALAIIMVMCIIICMLLLAYNANTLSRIEVLLQRR
jgi:hypothetical protein